MPKLKNSVRCRTNKIKVVRKTLGGGIKFSYLSSHSSSSHTDSSVPTPVIPVTEDTRNTHTNSFDEETAYIRAKRKELSLWDSLKDELLQVSYKTSAPASNICNICKEHADYRCLECSRTSVFCKTCVEKIHQNSLHLPEKWNKTFYEVAWLLLVLCLPGDHSAHGMYSRDINIFVNTGQLCSCRVDFCACEPEACTLLKYGLPHQKSLRQPFQ